MRENKAIHDDVSVEELAKLTKNFTGAELAGLVRAATAYALQRKIDIDPAKGFKVTEKIEKEKIEKEKKKRIKQLNERKTKKNKEKQRDKEN